MKFSPKLLLAATIFMQFAQAATPSCPAAAPVGTMRLLVRPPTENGPNPSYRSLQTVNRLGAGYKLWYFPGDTVNPDKPGEIAIVLVPQGKGEMKILEPRNAAKQTEWMIEEPVRLLGVFWGPHGLDHGKMKDLISKDPQMVEQMAAYAEQTAQAESLIRALTEGNRLTSSGQSVDTAVVTFANQFGTTSKLDRTAPPEQQTLTMLRALNPALSSYDPLATEPQLRAQQSAALAASVAGMFFGSTVGLTAAGAALFANMRTLIFPRTEFRSTFAQRNPSQELALCAKPGPQQPRTRLAYLWAVRIPDVDPPRLHLDSVPHLPIGLKSPAPARLERGSWEHVGRIEDWRLVGADGSRHPVGVTPDAKNDNLEVDLRALDAASGVYRLEGTWDWNTVTAGNVEVHSFTKLSDTKMSPESADLLVSGSGKVTGKLVAPTGSDLQFVEKLALRDPSDRYGQPVSLHFTLPQGLRGGVQDSLEFEVDTTRVRPGQYELLLTQLNGRSESIPVVVRPPEPQINGSVRLNVGENGQTITVRGEGLDRLDGMEAGEVQFEFGEGTSTERQARVKGAMPLKVGDRLPLKLQVQGRNELLQTSSMLEILGPRPQIQDVQSSLPPAAGVELRKGELPASSFASFALRVGNLAPAAEVKLQCRESNLQLRSVVIKPGEQTGDARLRYSPPDALFLSFDPGSVGQSGCNVLATVTNPVEGSSDPRELGGILRTPRISKFQLTDEQAEGNAFLGVIEGQDLELIERVGWSPEQGRAITSLPVPVADGGASQTLRVALEWPAPSPHAPLYVWLRGESSGRRTTARY